MIEEIKERIATIEAAIQQTVSHHATLTGHLTEAKHLLDLATKLAEHAIPESPLTECLEVVDKIADAVEESSAQE